MAGQTHRIGVDLSKPLAQQPETGHNRLESGFAVQPHAR